MSVFRLLCSSLMVNPLSPACTWYHGIQPFIVSSCNNLTFWEIGVPGLGELPYLVSVYCSSLFGTKCCTSSKKHDTSQCCPQNATRVVFLTTRRVNGTLWHPTKIDTLPVRYYRPAPGLEMILVATKCCAESCKFETKCNSFERQEARNPRKMQLPPIGSGSSLLPSTPQGYQRTLVQCMSCLDSIEHAKGHGIVFLRFPSRVSRKWHL